MIEAFQNLLPPAPEKRYRIHVLDDPNGYLNINYDDALCLDDSINQAQGGYKTIFSKDEVNKLKLRQGLNIDWDNALEEVEDE